jgi:hypothetical protein
MNILATRQPGPDKTLHRATLPPESPAGWPSASIDSPSI